MNRSGRSWPFGVAVVLAVTMAGNLWVMRLAGADTSVAVEPDYYRKAVAWDSVMAESARSAALDWRVTLDLTSAGADGLAPLTVTLHSAEGTPITTATVRVEATHNADANRVLSAELRPDGEGAYRAMVAATRAGIWQVRIVAIRGDDRFSATIRHDTSRDPRTP